MTYKDSRILDDWTGTFLEYMVAMPSPEIYNRWTAYNIVAGALERRVWTKLSSGCLYPNMLTMLVGNPGVGKSTAIREANMFWAATKVFNLAPLNTTKEMFMEQLGFLTKTFRYEDEAQVYSPLLVAINELATLLPDYDPEFLNTICDLYDCSKSFERRTKEGSVQCTKPHLNMIMATQPRYLTETLPEAIHGLGFISRSVMIYAGYHTPSLADKSISKRERLRVQLVNDLTSIGNLVGEFTWTLEAREFMENWNHKSTQDDAPSHEKLQSYNTRRVIHCIKLAMVMSVSRNGKMQITLEDVEGARAALVEVENTMPKIFGEA